MLRAQFSPAGAGIVSSSSWIASSVRRQPVSVGEIAHRLQGVGMLRAQVLLLQPKCLLLQLIASAVRPAAR